MVMLTSVCKSWSPTMQLQFDNQSDIPKDETGDFIEFEQDGKVIYMHKDLAESKKTAFRHQGQLTKLNADFDGFKTEINTKREQALKDAKEERDKALAKQMADLKDNGKTSELHKLELQQAEDKYQSLSDSNTKLQESFTGLQNSLVEKENLTLAMKIASEYVPSELVASFSKLLMIDHIKNVDGKSVFTNASGDAVDDDIDRVIEVLNQDPELKHYAKFPGSKGGFGGKGGKDARGGKTMSRKAFAELSPHEKSESQRKGVIIID